VAHGKQTELIEFGNKSPSSSAKTHWRPYSTVLESARSVAHAAGGAASKAVIQGCWFGRMEVIVKVFTYALLSTSRAVN
jgi:predicted Rossmann-fold nucleotide-binding protein